MSAKTSSTGLSESNFFLGFDIGSVSLNTAVIDENNTIVEEYYDYVHGRPFNVLKDRLSPEGQIIFCPGKIRFKNNKRYRSYRYRRKACHKAYWRRFCQ